MIRARSARLRRVVAARTHAVSCARSRAATANLVATAMPCLHHAITGMASELTQRDTSWPGRQAAMGYAAGDGGRDRAGAAAGVAGEPHPHMAGAARGWRDAVDPSRRAQPVGRNTACGLGQASLPL